MSEQISANETAAEKIPPLPFRVLWWRALIAMSVGGFSGWVVATFWCYVLGRFLFPSVFPAGRGIIAANQSVGLTTMAGAVLGLVLIFSRGTVLVRALASAIGLWLGGTAFLVGISCFGVLSYFLLTKLPTDNIQPPLTTDDYKYSLWTLLPMIFSGSSVLFSVFKMHVGNNANWFQTTKENIRESFIAVLKPQERHRLERFVLQSPLSLEECQARLPQIADVETSPFAFWEKLPLPGFKPLTVKAGNNHWRFSGRYRKAGFTFQADLTPIENGTQLHCVSRWIPLLKYYTLIFNGIFLFMLALFFLVFCAQAVSMLFGQKPSSPGPFMGLLAMVGMGLFFFALSRFFVWCSRQQELMVIENVERILEAQIIEREPVHYKWGFFEQLPGRSG